MKIKKSIADVFITNVPPLLNTWFNKGLGVLNIPQLGEKYSVMNGELQYHLYYYNKQYIIIKDFAEWAYYYFSNKLHKDDLWKLISQIDFNMKEKVMVYNPYKNDNYDLI